jgi:ketosteroid isomerase-like protein
VALIRKIVAFVGLAGALGCAHPRVDREAEKRKLLQADADFALDVAARGVEGWVEAFAPDGRMFASGQPIIQGAEAIRATMAVLGDPKVTPGALQLRWKPLFADVSDDGTLGWTFGNAHGVGPGGEFRSKYITIWKKQPGGAWKVVADMGTPGEAVPGAGPD